MKLIVAMIRPEKLPAVQQALDDAGVQAMYAGETTDVWHQRSRLYRGVEYQVAPPRLRLEILVVNEVCASEVVEAIQRAAFVADSGPQGSGDIFVMPLDDWTPIRAVAPAAQRELPDEHSDEKLVTASPEAR